MDGVRWKSLLKANEDGGVDGYGLTVTFNNVR